MEVMCILAVFVTMPSTMCTTFLHPCALTQTAAGAGGGLWGVYQTAVKSGGAALAGVGGRGR